MCLTSASLTCSVETLDYAKLEHRQQRDFTVNMVVPFSEIFAVKDKDSPVLRLPDTGGTMCQFPILTRIFKSLSSQVYSLLKCKMPNKQRAQFSTVSRQDGHGLKRKIRTVMDCVAATPLQILEHHKDSLKLESLRGWLEYRKKNHETCARLVWPYWRWIDWPWWEFYYIQAKEKAQRMYSHLEWIIQMDGIEQTQIVQNRTNNWGVW